MAASFNYADMQPKPTRDSFVDNRIRSSMNRTRCKNAAVPEPEVTTMDCNDAVTAPFPLLPPLLPTPAADTADRRVNAAAPSSPSSPFDSPKLRDRTAARGDVDGVGRAVPVDDVAREMT